MFATTFTRTFARTFPRSIYGKISRIGQIRSFNDKTDGFERRKWNGLSLMVVCSPIGDIFKGIKALKLSSMLGLNMSGDIWTYLRREKGGDFISEKVGAGMSG